MRKLHTLFYTMNLLPFAFVAHLAICYTIGTYARNKKRMGFNDAFLLTFMFPLIGLLIVLLSANKDKPENQPAKPVLKPELTDAEQKDFSKLLKQYHQKKISKEELDALSGSYKA